MICFQALLICLLAEMALGAKILAFLPLPARSHHIAFQPIIRELANRGHQVEYFTPVPLPDPPKNLKQIVIKNILSDLLGQMNMKDMMSLSVPANVAIISNMGITLAKRLYEEEPKFKKLLESNETYDAVIVELHFAQEYQAALVHKFKALGVAVVPLLDFPWMNELAGLPDNPSYMVNFEVVATDQMTFFERLHNLYAYVAILLIGYFFGLTKQQEFADTYIRGYDNWESRPSVLQMASDMALILSNSHHSLGYPYPKAPHVKEVGGMNVVPPKPLPKDLQNFMDSAKDGIIYFSYGSNVDMKQIITEDKFKAFYNNFKKLKQKILWKWKSEDAPKVDSPNILIQEWFPQQDILAHKNCKIFITHGGLMSTIEAINNGVPLIGTAVFGDQPKNMRFIEHKNIGINLEYTNITEASVGWAIDEVLHNPKYKNAMAKQSVLFKDRPMPPLEEAIFWIEYVLKHGKVLQPKSATMPFYQVYMLDLIAFLIFALFIILYLLKAVLRLMCGAFSKKNEELRLNDAAYSKKKKLV